MAKQKQQAFEPNESKFRLRLVLANGVDFTITSPIPAGEFQDEMQIMISQKAADPNWLGWYKFEKVDDGKVVCIKITQIVVVEEV